MTPILVIIPESTALAGAGATGCAVGSHACIGNIPALTPKPSIITKNTARKTGACAEESEYLARCLLSALGSITGAHTQGVYRRDTYTGLNWSEVPCVLAELGYMTNPEEDEKTAQREYQLLLARGIALGLCAYFETR